MVIEVVTRECASVGDAELADVAAFCAQSHGIEMGAFSKLAERWVLLSQAYRDDEMCGLMFSTLERIGGTPAIVIGFVSISGVSTCEQVVGALRSVQFHKAAMAFPDEDVVVSVLIDQTEGFCVLDGLEGTQPSLVTKAGGEERAWGRRLAKYFGIEEFDDRLMVGGNSGDALAMVYPDSDSQHSEDRLALAERLATDKAVFVAWGWAYCEFLEQYA